MVQVSIIEMSMTAAVLVAAIVIIRFIALYSLPKKMFVILWGVVLLRLLIPYSITLPSEMPILSSLSETRITSDFIPAEQIPVVFIMPGDALQESRVFPARQIWIMGMVISALFFLSAHLRWRREYAAGLPLNNDYIDTWLKTQNLWRDIQVRHSDRVPAPVTYGLLQPVILLPKTMDFGDFASLRYVLAHEITHIRRFDILLKWLLAAALCVHWFNPFVWVMYVLAGRDIEMSCDEAVVQSTESKASYARALISMEERKSGFAPTYNYFAKNAIKERISAIMKTRKSITGIITAIIMTIMLAAGSLTAFAAERPEIGREMRYLGRFDGGTFRFAPDFDRNLRLYEVDGVTPFDFNRSIQDRIHSGELYIIDSYGRLQVREGEITIFHGLPMLPMPVVTPPVTWERLETFTVEFTVEPIQPPPIILQRLSNAFPIVDARGRTVMWLTDADAFFAQTYEELNQLLYQMATAIFMPLSPEVIELIRQHWLYQNTQ